MTEPTITDLQKELVDLKIRVNNLEKKMSRLQKEKKPKPKTCSTRKYI
jgi:predicted  nucleic acid-binding Zn-ribbon protein